MAPVHDAADRGETETLAKIAREDPGQLRLRDAFDRTPLLWVRRGSRDESLIGSTLPGSGLMVRLTPTIHNRRRPAAVKAPPPPGSSITRTPPKP